MTNLRKYLYIIAAIYGSMLSLQSCYTQRKAEQQIRKADVTFPQSTATFCASRFPVVPRTSTVIETNTDTLYQQGDTMILGDTVYINRIKTVTNTIRTTIHDTIPDVAAINTLQGINTTLQADIRTWQDRAVEAQDKAESRGKWRWMFWGLLVLVIAYIVWRVIISLKTVNIKTK